MFWDIYGSAVRWMFAVEALAGGLILFTAAAWFMPSEPGDQFGGAFVLAVYGSVAGLLTATTASLMYRFCLGPWTRRAHRSRASRAWVGTGAAAVGAYAPWLVFGIYGLWLGLVPALIAMMVAGPFTARAARRADLTTDDKLSDVPSEGLT